MTTRTIPTRKQAEAVLSLVNTRHANEIFGWTLLGKNGEPDIVFPALPEIDHPQLRMNKRNTGWEIVWEAGDYDWPMRLTEHLFITEKDAGPVFLEPVNSYSLGIYVP